MAADAATAVLFNRVPALLPAVLYALAPGGIFAAILVAVFSGVWRRACARRRAPSFGLIAVNR